jgi:D-3-phosphoglycerate dehydrogenase
MNKKVLVSSRAFGKLDSTPIDIIENAGFEVIKNPYGRKLEENELLELISDVIGMIAGTEAITENVIINADSLRVISRGGTGLDNVDLNAAEKYGVTVYNTPDALTQAVAELTIALILALHRRIVEADGSIRKGVWIPVMGRLLENKTIGVIGLGRIGKQVVRLLQPFGLNFIAFEPNPDNDFVREYQISLKSLTDLFKESDILTLHLPLNNETYHIVGEKELSFIKKDAIIINTSRGGLIDENALYNSLKKGLIGGSALDTFEDEPYNGPLKNLYNVVLTPHIGSYAKEARSRMEIEAAKNLINGLKEKEIK